MAVFCLERRENAYYICKEWEICIKDVIPQTAGAICCIYFHSRGLQRLFCLDGRTLRRKVHNLRADGVPICSDQGGYYYADTQAEINRTVGRLNTLVTKISNARTGLLYSSLLDCGDGISLQVSVKLVSEG